MADYRSFLSMTRIKARRKNANARQPLARSEFPFFLTRDIPLSMTALFYLYPGSRIPGCQAIQQGSEAASLRFPICVT
jgi:hypothetical protein